MASTSIIEPGQFDVSKLKINPKVRTLNNSAKSVYVNYDGFAPLVVETGNLYCPFGISAYTDEGTGIVKYTLSVSLRNPESDKNTGDLKSMLVAMDAAAQQVAFENSLAFFKKNQVMEVVKAIYKPCIRPAMVKGMATDDYPPTFRMSLPFRDGSFGDLEVYDCHRKQMDMMELVANPGSTKNSTVRCIIQCTGMWITGSTGFGYTWKILQMKFAQPVNSGGIRTLKGYGFKNTAEDEVVIAEDEDDEQPPAAAVPKTRAAPKAAPTTTYVSDSEEEEEEEEAAPPAPASAPAPVAPAPVPVRSFAALKVEDAAEDDEEEEEEKPVMTRTFSKPPARKTAASKK
jgi:hypothetical protein